MPTAGLIAGTQPFTKKFFTSLTGPSLVIQTSPILFALIRGTVPTASTDATLSGLELEDASNGSAIALDPAFAPDHFDYAASVRFAVSRITVTPTKNDPTARIFPLQGRGQQRRAQ